jgi:hypothetical protein
MHRSPLCWNASLLCWRLLAQYFSLCARGCEFLTQGLGGLLLVDPGRAPAAADEAEESSPTQALVDALMYGPSQWAIRSS